jgi:deoxyhypusine synthase
MASAGEVVGNGEQSNAVPSMVSDAVLKPSVLEGKREEVKGIDFDEYEGRDITVAEMLAGMTSMGFQASAVAEAVRIINDMVGGKDLSMSTSTADF